jgi:hypothetical protein
MSCHRAETAGLFWLSMDRQMLGRLRFFMYGGVSGGELVSHFTRRQPATVYLIGVPLNSG